jgi:nucleotide-binding universal stress UspA family protein
VVPVDGSELSERALPVGREIARRLNARVLLMDTHWDDVDQQRKRSYLIRLAGQGDDVPTDVATVDVHPNAPAIEHLVSDDPDRIVCMASHGRGRARWAVLGSVAEQVVHETRRPIVLVGRHCRDDWPDDSRYLLVCVDGKTVADPVIPVAIRWAQALGLDVQVAVVVHPLDLDVGGFPRAVVGAIVARFAAHGVHATPVALRGTHTAGVIADYVSDSPVALVAMNTHARGGLGRLALGSVAMGTVGLVECPVLLAPTPDHGS